MTWLAETFPSESPLTILAACTYEIGRIVTIAGLEMSRAEREAMLKNVIAIMRDQITSGQTR